MSATKIVRAGPLKRIYLEFEGARGRTHDCTFGAGKLKARHRVFVAANCVKKSYAFMRGEPKELTEPRLEAQSAGGGVSRRHDPALRVARHR